MWVYANKSAASSRGLTQCLIPKHPKQANKHCFPFLFKTFSLYFFLTWFSHLPPSIRSASAHYSSSLFTSFLLYFLLSEALLPPQNPVLSEFCLRVCWNRTNLWIKHEQIQILSQSLNWIYLLKTLKPELLRLSANRWLKPEGSVISEEESFIERETSVNLPSSSCRATKIWRNSRKRFVSGGARTLIRFSCCFVFNHFKYVESFWPRSACSGSFWQLVVLKLKQNV